MRYAAIGFVVDAAIFRTVDEIDSIAAHAAAILTEATAVAVMRAREVEKRILHLDAFDVGDAGGRNVHVAAGVDAVTMGRGAHAGAVDVVETLRNGDALAGMAAVEITRPADEF